MKKTLLFITLLINISNLCAQKEYYNWYFGNPANLTFNTSDLHPEIMERTPLSNHEGVSCISDSAANFLIYTNGEAVYNKNCEIMPNGDSILSVSTTSQSSLIVKKPGYNSIYYVFTTGVDSAYHRYEDQPQISLGYRYSIVDMNEDSGYGDVIEKNILITGPSTEKICGTMHRNNKDIWIITRIGGTNQYHSFLLTEDGLMLMKVNTIGPACGYINPGYMKFSPDGKKFAHARAYYYYDSDDREWRGEITILDFNDSTGEFSNPVVLSSYPAYGVEFSPDGTKLYYSAFESYPIYQLDLTAGSAEDIANSRIYLNGYENCQTNAMQLGPDGKIYIVKIGGQFLGIINNPNAAGHDCAYIRDGIYLGYNRYGTYGLPNCLASAFRTRMLINAQDVCLGDTLFLSGLLTMNTPAENFSWNGPNGFYSEEQDITIPGATSQNEGWYIASAENDGNIYTDSVFVRVRDIQAEIRTDKSPDICIGDSITLKAYPTGSDYTYLWSTGETTEEITVSEEGEYSLIVEDEIGCTGAADIEVTVNPGLVVTIIKPEGICPGDSAVLSAEPFGDNYSYLWSDGQTGREIMIGSDGEYSVTVTNEIGCSGSDTVRMEYYMQPSVEISGADGFCRGDTATLRVKKGFVDYQWSNGSDSNTTQVWEEGEYSIAIINGDGCKAYDTVMVEYYPKPTAIITGDTQLCEGEETKLSSANEHESYEWSTGETTRNITVSQAGEYQLIVWNEYGCSDTAITEVSYYPNPEPKILPPGKLCEGEEATLSADTIYATYEWSTGGKGPETTVSKAGDYWLKVTNENGCEGYDTISIEYIEMDIEVNPLEIEYDFVMLGDDKSGNIIITNNGDEDIEYTISQLQNIFEISGYTGTISSKSSETLSIRFIPANIIDYDDILNITVTEPCSAEYSVSLSGSGRAELLASIPDIKTKIGERECIPVYAKILGNNDLQSTAAFEARISLDAEAMRTDIYGELSGQQRIITLSGNDITLSTSDTQIGEICGDVLIGRRDQSPIDFISFNWTDEHLISDTTNGSLSIEGQCVRNLSRLNFFQATKMQISPNPAGESLDINIISEENGAFELTLYNLQGVEVESYSWQTNLEDERIINIDTENYSNGAYIVMLKSPTEVLVRNIYILK